MKITNIAVMATGNGHQPKVALIIRAKISPFTDVQVIADKANNTAKIVRTAFPKRPF